MNTVYAPTQQALFEQAAPVPRPRKRQVQVDASLLAEVERVCRLNAMGLEDALRQWLRSKGARA